MSKKNALLDVKFNELDEVKKMEVLGVDENTFTSARFKGVDKSVVINDLWCGKTNSEKRSLLSV